MKRFTLVGFGLLAGSIAAAVKQDSIIDRICMVIAMLGASVPNFWLALLLVLITAAVFIPAVLIPYHHTGLVERFPTLIVCGFAAIAAILSFFNGMLLDTIMQKERREFEYRLVQIARWQREDHD